VKDAIAGQDVFAVSPSGYGKSLCYGCQLHFHEIYKPSESAAIYVASPLLGIIEEQNYTSK